MKESGLYIIQTNLTGNCYQLYDLATWKNGAAFKGVKVSPTGKPIIKIAELNNGISESTTRTDDLFSEDILMHNGDLAFSWSGNPETSIDIFRYKLPDGWLNQHIFKITVNEKEVDKDFFFYLMKYLKPNFRKIASNKQTTGLGHVTIADLKSISVIIPDRNIQRYIARILKSLDDKIAVNKKICENLEAQAQALFKHWFVDFAPFKDGKFVESELGLIPEGWRVGNLFDIASIFDKIRKPLSGKDREYMNKIYPYYGATSCMDYVDSYLFDGIYTLIGEDGSVVKEDGLPYMQYVWGKFWVNNHAHILQGKNGFSTEMVHVFLSRYNIKHLVTGAVQAKLSQANMQKIMLPIPPKDEINKIRPVIDSLYGKIRNCEEESSCLATLRDTLLPKLMSGEISIE